MARLVSYLGLLALLSGPAQADEAKALWDLFAEKCARAINAPLANALTSLTNPLDGNATAFTEDGALFVGVEPVPSLQSDTIAFVSVTYSGDRYADVQTGTCTLQAVLNEKDTMLGLYELAKTRAADVIGGEPVVLGGKLLTPVALASDMDGFTPYAAVFAAPGPFPPPLSIRVTEVPRSASLTLTKITELKDQ